MHYEIVELPARTIVGPTVRTSNNSPALHGRGP